MNNLLIPAIIAITLALVSYTTGVWTIWLVPYIAGMVVGIH